jgi:uncharacterized membrane protein
MFVVFKREEPLFMSINPNQGQKPDPNDPYGAYSGYAPQQQPAQPAQPTSDDPYNSQWYGQQGNAQQTGGYSTGQQQQSYGTGQQQQTYQPPRSAYNTSSSSDPSGPSTMSMNPRIAALLSNALIWIGGLFFFFAERKNRFVRFNAAQSILFFGSVSIVFEVISLLSFLTLIPFIGWAFGIILGAVHLVLLLGAALVWAFLCFQAYRGAKTKLPFFGDYAEKLVARFTR